MSSEKFCFSHFRSHEDRSVIINISSRCSLLLIALFSLQIQSPSFESWMPFHIFQASSSSSISFSGTVKRCICVHIIQFQIMANVLEWNEKKNSQWVQNLNFKYQNHFCPHHTVMVPFNSVIKSNDLHQNFQQYLFDLNRFEPHNLGESRKIPKCESNRLF